MAAISASDQLKKPSKERCYSRSFLNSSSLILPPLAALYFANLLCLAIKLQLKYLVGTFGRLPLYLLGFSLALASCDDATKDQNSDLEVSKVQTEGELRTVTGNRILSVEYGDDSLADSFDQGPLPLSSTAGDEATIQPNDLLAHRLKVLSGLILARRQFLNSDDSVLTDKEQVEFPEADQPGVQIALAGNPPDFSNQHGEETAIQLPENIVYTDTLTLQNQRMQELKVCYTFLPATLNYYSINYVEIIYNSGHKALMGEQPHPIAGYPDAVQCKQLTLRKGDVISFVQTAHDGDHLTGLTIKLTHYEINNDLGVEHHIETQYEKTFTVGRDGGVPMPAEDLAGFYGTLNDSPQATGVAGIVDHNARIVSLGMIKGDGQSLDDLFDEANGRFRRVRWVRRSVIIENQCSSGARFSIYTRRVDSAIASMISTLSEPTACHPDDLRTNRIFGFFCPIGIDTEEHRETANDPQFDRYFISYGKALVNLGFAAEMAQSISNRRKAADLFNSLNSSPFGLNDRDFDHIYSSNLFGRAFSSSCSTSSISRITTSRQFNPFPEFDGDDGDTSQDNPNYSSFLRVKNAILNMNGDEIFPSN